MIFHDVCMYIWEINYPSQVKPLLLIWNEYSSVYGSLESIMTSLFVKFYVAFTVTLIIYLGIIGNMHGVPVHSPVCDS